MRKIQTFKIKLLFEKYSLYTEKKKASTKKVYDFIVLGIV